MLDKQDKPWLKLCDLAAVEKDPLKLDDLLAEIFRLMAEWQQKSTEEEDPTMTIGTDTFDIFSGRSNRHAVWMEAAIGIDRARERMHHLANVAPGEYFIFHSKSRVTVDSVHTRQKGDQESPRRTGAA